MEKLLLWAICLIERRLPRRLRHKMFLRDLATMWGEMGPPSRFTEGDRRAAYAYYNTLLDYYRL